MPSGDGGELRRDTLVQQDRADCIRIATWLGVEGDTHSGEPVQRRSQVARDPSQPNLRQVHVMHAELHNELRLTGFMVSAGQMGENITTRGVDLLGLPTGAQLRLARRR